METLNYKVLEGTGYNGYILKDAPVKVMQFGEGNFLRAFVDYFYDIANEKAGYNGKVKLVQPISNFPQMADWINEQEGLYTLYLRGSEQNAGHLLVFGKVLGKDEILEKIAIRFFYNLNQSVVNRRINIDVIPLKINRYVVFRPVRIYLF